MALKKFLMVGIVAVLVACGDESGNSVTNSDEDSSSSSSAESSSSEQSSSSVTLAIPCKTDSTDTCEYGELVDERDDQAYKTVSIGPQTWMVENLNYKTDASYCYGDESSNCTKYGRLYMWDAAKTACPAGWRLPTIAEFKALYTNVGGQFTAGTKLKSTSDWNGGCNGSDDYSFSALPAGYRRHDGKYYGEISYAFFWSSTEYNSDHAFHIKLKYDDYSAYLDFSDKDDGFSVRCVKD